MKLGPGLTFSWKRLIVATIAGALVLTACGSSNNGAARKEYAKFCAFLNATAESATSSHEQNPAAITDPEVYKTESLKTLGIYKSLIAKAPADIKDELEVFLANAVATNKIYEKYDYDLVAMAKNPEAQEELAAVSNEKTAIAAKDRYQKVLAGNCDFDTN